MFLDIAEEKENIYNPLDHYRIMVAKWKKKKKNETML